MTNYYSANEAWGIPAADTWLPFPVVDARLNGLSDPRVVAWGTDGISVRHESREGGYVECGLISVKGIAIDETARDHLAFWSIVDDLAGMDHDQIRARQLAQEDVVAAQAKRSRASMRIGDQEAIADVLRWREDMFAWAPVPDRESWAYIRTRGVVLPALSLQWESTLPPPCE